MGGGGWGWVGLNVTASSGGIKDQGSKLTGIGGVMAV